MSTGGVSFFPFSFSDYRGVGGLICGFPDWPRGKKFAFVFQYRLAGKEHRRRVAMTVPLIRIQTSELHCSYTTVATFVGLPSGSSGQKSINMLTTPLAAAVVR
jgi:hypothetical protein